MNNNKKKDKALYVFLSPQMITLGIGSFLVCLFIFIYLIIVIITKQIDFYSLFFRKALSHFFLTVLSGLHVSILGIGILLILISFLKMRPNIYCYKDKFIIKMFLHKNIEINYKTITECVIKICYLYYDNFFNNSPRKECRVFFNNPIYNFYLSYPIKGYFDNVSLFLKNRKDQAEGNLADRKSIIDILNIIKKNHSFILPYLPEQIRT